MCSGPYCGNNCRSVTRSGKGSRVHMARAYIRVYDGRRRLRTVPVGWWCPACHAFRDETAPAT